jgi:hypothetical protein
VPARQRADAVRRAQALRDASVEHQAPYSSREKQEERHFCIENLALDETRQSVQIIIVASLDKLNERIALTGLGRLV